VEAVAAGHAAEAAAAGRAAEAEAAQMPPAAASAGGTLSRSVAYLVLCFSFALAGGFVGRSKGSSFVLWFLIAGVVPVLGLAAALLFRSERDEVRRQCPTCGKVIKLHDQVCTRCGEDLEFPETGVVPESAAAAVGRYPAGS
jgi:hypothetical protein